ncbi:hypothetical protein LIER_11110 [Lithospermum erythrorhizon]|uniref:Uncharacterized protein n=1 Tax=Lithospermum erythrorhizon TaxID=34254 RepID=A0AAV3PN29_LITER
MRIASCSTPRVVPVLNTLAGSLPSKGRRPKIRCRWNYQCPPTFAYLKVRNQWCDHHWILMRAFYPLKVFPGEGHVRELGACLCCYSIDIPFGRSGEHPLVLNFQKDISHGSAEAGQIFDLLPVGLIRSYPLSGARIPYKVLFLFGRGSSVEPLPPDVSLVPSHLFSPPPLSGCICRIPKERQGWTPLRVAISKIFSKEKDGETGRIPEGDACTSPYRPLAGSTLAYLLAPRQSIGKLQEFSDVKSKSHKGIIRGIRRRHGSWRRRNILFVGLHDLRGGFDPLFSSLRCTFPRGSLRRNGRSWRMSRDVVGVGVEEVGGRFGVATGEMLGEEASFFNTCAF